MDEFIGGIGAEEFADFGGAEALEETDLGAGILGEALGDPAAGEVMDVDEVAGGEIAGDGADADGQEAFAAQEKGVAGAIIDGEGSLGVVEEGDPAATVWRMSLVRPSAMTTGVPIQAASAAEVSLLAMPPVEKMLPLPLAWDRVSAVTSAR